MQHSATLAGPLPPHSLKRAKDHANLTSPAEVPLTGVFTELPQPSQPTPRPDFLCQAGRDNARHRADSSAFISQRSFPLLPWEKRGGMAAVSPKVTVSLAHHAASFSFPADGFNSHQHLEASFPWDVCWAGRMSRFWQVL